MCALKGQLHSAQGRGPERQRRDGTLGMRVPAFYVRPARATTYPSVFYSAALTGRWVGGRVGYPGRCPGLGVAGPSARLLFGTFNPKPKTQHITALG